MKKLLMTFGTRPEAIKMAPLYRELKRRESAGECKAVLAVTAQHREQLDQVLEAFEIVPDYDLNIMKDRQTLNDVLCNSVLGIDGVFKSENPDVVIVHGDTATTFACALSAFHSQISVAHVEAGLRTWEKYAPFPEEMYRQMTDNIADYYFAPTKLSKQNLIKEGKEVSKIYITGNTAIDAVFLTEKKETVHEELKWASDSRLILLTAHRRENLGEPIRNLFRGLLKIINEFPDVKVVYPIHMNPAVREAADEIFGGCSRIRLIEPLEIVDFHNFMRSSYLIVTDSGGIQEEAPSLKKPVLVARDVTERPEGITAGTLKLTGTDLENVYENIKELLNNPLEYKRMADAANPYGDGKASARIADVLIKGTCSEFFE